MKNSIRKVSISILSIFIFTGAMGIPRTVNAKKIILFKKCTANIEIVKPSSATDFENQAAYDLKEYLEKVTKATIVIKLETDVIEKIPVYVGKCSGSRHLFGIVEALTNDGYAIEIDKDSIHLLGKNDLATRFAVYGFLEDYIDVHWFFPEVWGDDFPENMGTYIPQKGTIRLKRSLDIQDPSFKYRNFPRDNLWTIHNKMNFINHDEEGFQINRYAHSFGYFLTPKKYSGFPDYFAMVDGKLMTAKEILEQERGKIKLNVAKIEVKQAMTNEVINYIDDDVNSGIDIINLFPGDGLGFDESRESIKIDGETHMDSEVTVEDVNHKGRALGEEFGRVLSKRYTIFYHDVTNMILGQRPDTLLMTGAYSAYQYAPLEVKYDRFISRYKMKDGVILLIVHSDNGNNHPIEERNTLVNYHFDESMAGWKELYSRFGVYEYYRAGRMCELPYPIIHSIRRDIPYYYRNDFVYFFTQYKLYNTGTYGLNDYIAAKLIWNANLNVDLLLEEFCRKFYGNKAGVHMRKYFDQLEQAAIDSNVELPPRSGSGYGVFLDLFTDNTLAACRKHLASAKAMAKGNELWSKRIELSAVSLNYTKKVIEYLKEIRSIIDINNKLRCRTFTLDEIANATEMAEEINEMITQVEPYKTIRNTKNTDRLLDVDLATKDFYEDFTKAKWIELNNIDAQKGYGNNELFDIWIYAYDVDFDPTFDPPDEDKSEHRISVIDRHGSSVEIGPPLAQSVAEEGNNIDKGFLRSSFSFEDLIGSNDNITLEIFNNEGGKKSSKFYAIAIMPHMEDIGQDDVTWYYVNDINFIRNHSVGFIEMSERNEDNQTLTVEIDLFSHK